MSKSNLENIKSKMNWQLGVQAASLLAIGELNSSISKQSQIINHSIKSLEETTINGFENIEDVLNSLETNLIKGIEDIKWFLGSIDSKLGKLIGLIEYSNATESSENFTLGMELYKQGFQKKSLDFFNKSIKSNPLNLNSMIGIYLCKKSINKIPNTKIISDIIKLTNSNFLYHINPSDSEKEISINYFLNFCFSELIDIKKYDIIIKEYENLQNFSKDYLPIRLKYINSLVLAKRDYTDEIKEIIDEGLLKKLLIFFDYESKDKSIVDFIKKIKDLIKDKIPNYSSAEERTNLLIQRKAQILNDYLSENSFDFAYHESNMQEKIDSLNLFYSNSQNANHFYDKIEKTLNSNESSVELVNKYKKPTIWNEKNKYLNTSQKNIYDKINKALYQYINDSKKKYKASISLNKIFIEQFKSGFPKLDNLKSKEFEIINLFMDNIDEENEKVELTRILNKINYMNREIEMNKKMKHFFKVIKTNLGESTLSSLGYKEYKEKGVKGWLKWNVQTNKSSSTENKKSQINLIENENYTEKVFDIFWSSSIKLLNDNNISI